MITTWSASAWPLSSPRCGCGNELRDAAPERVARRIALVGKFAPIAKPAQVVAEIKAVHWGEKLAVFPTFAMMLRRGRRST
jgi:hypothetical protein